MSFIFRMFVLLITKTIIMKSSKPFWQSNLNPITMLPSERNINRKDSEEVIMNRRERKLYQSLKAFEVDLYGRTKKSELW